jgi:hypothetical protein
MLITQGRQEREDDSMEPEGDDGGEIVEFTCPEVGDEVSKNAVVVSSIGAVCGHSLEDLEKALKCSDRELRKRGRQASESGIVGFGRDEYGMHEFDDSQSLGIERGGDRSRTDERTR